MKELGEYSAADVALQAAAGLAQLGSVRRIMGGMNRLIDRIQSGDSTFLA